MADGCPADRIANYRDPVGKPLPARVAAVELLNLLRPVVAISYFVLYALVALARRPQWRTRLQEDGRALLLFVQEVRRLYAFFPFVPARVARPFEWQGLQFRRGARVLLDLFGSNRCGETWVARTNFARSASSRCNSTPTRSFPRAAATTAAVTAARANG